MVSLKTNLARESSDRIHGVLLGNHLGLCHALLVGLTSFWKPLSYSFRPLHTQCQLLKSMKGQQCHLPLFPKEVSLHREQRSKLNLYRGDYHAQLLANGSTVISKNFKCIYQWDEPIHTRLHRSLSCVSVWLIIFPCQTINSIQQPCSTFFVK